MQNKSTWCTLTMALMLVVSRSIVGDNVAPSQSPPNDIPVFNVPQFLVFGFDDQDELSGMQAVIGIFKQRKNPQGLGQKETFDGTPLRCAFYTAGQYLDYTTIKNLHYQALSDGFEIGNHTYSHTTGFNTSQSTWENEMEQCNSMLASAGIPEESIVGFRTPFLEYNNATFKAMTSLGFLYDCSIEEGFEKDQTAGSYFWPHTLDNGSPGNKAMIELNQPYELIKSYPGIWEIACYDLILPHDSICENYGISRGLRARTCNTIDYFDTTTGKLTGLDYNLIEEAEVSADEFLGILKYTLDLNYEGNRAPMTFGAHSRYYSNTTWARQLEDFIDYALSYPDVRIVRPVDLISWMRDPTPLDTGVTGITDDLHRKYSTDAFRINVLPHRSIQISGYNDGTVTAALFALNGKKIPSVCRGFSHGKTRGLVLTASSVSAGVVIVSVKNRRMTYYRKVQLRDGF